MFREVSPRISFPELERQILEFWETHGIYAKSLENRRGAKNFVFFEGPPTANGLPHPGHCLTRTIKDVFPRYFTMRGFCCERKAGWDTHGLPVEIEVGKELGIHSKQEIEEYGIEPFIHKCIQSVFRYTREWEELTRRLGFWVNLEEAYVTYHQSYVESVWWALKRLFDRGLLYQGHKVVWWWAQGGTALSAGEVGEGYRQTEDPSIVVRFAVRRLEAGDRRLEDGYRRPETGDRRPETGDRRAESNDSSGPLLSALRPPASSLQPPVSSLQPLFSNVPTSLLAWTTTPWTLSSNIALAVHSDIDYVLLEYQTDTEHERFLLAEELVEETFGGLSIDFEKTMKKVGGFKGSELVGLKYEPIFRYSEPTEGRQWEVDSAPFVTLEQGTGIVHVAPAFGEDDYRFAQEKGFGFLQMVKPDGTFREEASEVAGQFCKDADKQIIRLLKERKVLLKRGTVRHPYPFCPRAEEDPLIQYARKSWFIRTTQFKDQFLANNAEICWLPEHIKEGRFGDFLRNNVDWAISRERFWGTPLPIWECESTGFKEAIGSYQELLEKPGVQGTEVWLEAKSKNPELCEDLRIHKPYIDAVTYQSPKDSTARMRRVPEVIDCWFDAGAMPFAQWGFPHQNREKFLDQFPADFISEAIDQTRGWFYGLLAISTLLQEELGEGLRPEAGGWRSESGERRAESGEPRAESGEPRAESGEPRSESGERRAESREPRAESNDSSGPLLSALRPPASSLRPPASSLQSPASSLQPPASSLQPPASSLKPPASSLQFPIPFRKCIVTGHLMGEDGKKMSKRLGNYREPAYIFDHYGADALRWFLLSGQAPWNSIRFKESAIQESQREFLIRLHNVFGFFVIYANIDGFDPQATPRPSVADRALLDRWILSELHKTIGFATKRMDLLDNFPAAGRINEFVDSLSNWYVRRCRQRIWAKGLGPDKQAAHWTLYECLLEISKLIAPFVPFFAESMYLNLTGGWRPEAGGLRPESGDRRPDIGERRAESNDSSGPLLSALQPPASNLQPPASSLQPPVSVHLCDWPTSDGSLIDEALSDQMDLVREVVSVGRSARTDAKLKVRQPLSAVEVLLADHRDDQTVVTYHDLIAEELNVKRVELAERATDYVEFSVEPNLKQLGPRYGKKLPAIGKALSEADGAELRQALIEHGELKIDIDDEEILLSSEEVFVNLSAKPGYAAAEGRRVVVVLATEITPELRLEGLARELVHHIQGMRRDLDLAFDDRIRLGIVAGGQVGEAVTAHSDYVKGETLAVELMNETLPEAEMTQTITIADSQVTVSLAKAK